MPPLTSHRGPRAAHDDRGHTLDSRSLAPAEPRFFVFGARNAENLRRFGTVTDLGHGLYHVEVEGR